MIFVGVQAPLLPFAAVADRSAATHAVHGRVHSKAKAAVAHGKTRKAPSGAADKTVAEAARANIRPRQQKNRQATPHPAPRAARPTGAREKSRRAYRSAPWRERHRHGSDTAQECPSHRRRGKKTGRKKTRSRGEKGLPHAARGSRPPPQAKATDAHKYPSCMRAAYDRPRASAAPCRTPTEHPSKLLQKRRQAQGAAAKRDPRTCSKAPEAAALLFSFGIIKG